MDEPREAEPVSAADEAAILALNNAHATELSWLDAARLAALLRMAFAARRIGAADGFLLAFDETAAYDSPNYRWFRARFERFVYVDRVVLAPAARGRGHARRLYANLMAQAVAAGHTRLACEVNIDPPNPASDAFHARMGFAEIGRAVIHSGDKTVRYLVLELGGASNAAVKRSAVSRSPSRR